MCPHDLKSPFVLIPHPVSLGPSRRPSQELLPSIGSAASRPGPDLVSPVPHSQCQLTYCCIFSVAVVPAFQRFLRFRALADMNSDGRMDIHEFSIAMKLIKLKLQGHPLPPALPPSMKQPQLTLPPQGGFGETVFLSAV